MRTLKREIVGAVLVSADEKVLFGLRRADGVYPGTWHIPGGGIETGETEQEALVREIREETRIDITGSTVTLLDDQSLASAEKTLSSGETVFCDMHFFTYRIDLQMPADSYAVLPSEEFERVEWIAIAKIRTLVLPPPSIYLFGKLGWL
jgi:8-oxo-dGTP pyrophosphatase MutT (NUDIX family)